MIFYLEACVLNVEVSLALRSMVALGIEPEVALLLSYLVVVVLEV